MTRNCASTSAPTTPSTKRPGAMATRLGIPRRRTDHRSPRHRPHRHRRTPLPRSRLQRHGRRSPHHRPRTRRSTITALPVPVQRFLRRFEDDSLDDLLHTFRDVCNEQLATRRFLDVLSGAERKAAIRAVSEDASDIPMEPGSCRKKVPGRLPRQRAAPQSPALSTQTTAAGSAGQERSDLHRRRALPLVTLAITAYIRVDPSRAFHTMMVISMIRTRPPCRRG